MTSEKHTVELHDLNSMYRNFRRSVLNQELTWRLVNGDDTTEAESLYDLVDLNGSVVIPSVGWDTALLLTDLNRSLPNLLIAAANRFERAKCTKCDAMAVWDYMPRSDHDLSRCDEHIDRGCSCNFIDFEDKSPDAEQQRDEDGRLLPCIEYEYEPLGFTREDQNREAADAPASDPAQ